MVKHQEYISKNTIQQTAVVTWTFGTDKSVPYEHAGRRPIQLPDKFQFYCVTRIYNIMYIRENQLLSGLKFCEGSVFQRGCAQTVDRCPCVKISIITEFGGKSL